MERKTCCKVRALNGTRAHFILRWRRRVRRSDADGSERITEICLRTSAVAICGVGGVGGVRITHCKSSRHIPTQRTVASGGGAERARRGRGGFPGFLCAPPTPPPGSGGRPCRQAPSRRRAPRGRTRHPAAGTRGYHRTRPRPRRSAAGSPRTGPRAPPGRWWRTSVVRERRVGVSGVMSALWRCDGRHGVLLHMIRGLGIFGGGEEGGARTAGAL